MTESKKKEYTDADREYQRAYREQNRERIARLKLLWRKRNPEREDKYHFREKLRKKGIDPDTWVPPEQRKNEYVRRNIDWNDPEQRKAYFKENYQAHKRERARAANAYYWRNKEKISALRSAKYIDKKDEIIARQKAYREANREAIRIKAREAYRRRREELGFTVKRKIQDEHTQPLDPGADSHLDETEA